MGFEVIPSIVLREPALPPNNVIKNCRGTENRREKLRRILSVQYPLVCLFMRRWLLYLISLKNYDKSKVVNELIWWITILLYTFILLLRTTIVWMWFGFCTWMALYMNSIMHLCGCGSCECALVSRCGLVWYVDLLFDMSRWLWIKCYVYVDWFLDGTNFYVDFLLIWTAGLWVNNQNIKILWHIFMNSA